MPRSKSGHFDYTMYLPIGASESWRQDAIYGLRRSSLISLIMGAHPGCPVCSIVAASLVAVVTDVGETISVAKIAFVCGL